MRALRENGVVVDGEPAPLVVLRCPELRAAPGLVPLDSAARVLSMFDPDTFRAEIEALTSTDPEHHATGAMFMTEVDGGTDLGQTATVATDQ